MSVDLSIVNPGRSCPSVEELTVDANDACGWQNLSFTYPSSFPARSSAAEQSAKCWRMTCYKKVEMEWYSFKTFCNALPPGLAPVCGDTATNSSKGYCDDVTMHTFSSGPNALRVSSTGCQNTPPYPCGHRLAGTCSAENGLLVELWARWRGSGDPPAGGGYSFSMKWRCPEYCTSPPTISPTGAPGPTASPSVAATSPPSAASSSSSDDSLKQIIAGTIIAFLAVLGLILYCWYSNRTKRQQAEEQARAAAEPAPDVRPVDTPPKFKPGDRVMHGGYPGVVRSVNPGPVPTYSVDLDSGSRLPVAPEPSLSPGPTWRPKYRISERVEHAPKTGKGHGRVVDIDWKLSTYSVCFDQHSQAVVAGLPEVDLLPGRPRYKPGDRVVHQGGGPGTVTEVRPDGSYGVQLDDGGAVAADEAKLEPGSPRFEVGDRVVSTATEEAGRVVASSDGREYAVAFDNGHAATLPDHLLQPGDPRFPFGAIVVCRVEGQAPIEGTVVGVGPGGVGGPQYAVDLMNGKTKAFAEDQLVLAPPRHSVGDRVLASWLGTDTFEKGTVAAVHTDGSYAVKFDDGEYDPQAMGGFMQELLPYEPGEAVYARRGGPTGLAQPAQVLRENGDGTFEVAFHKDGQTETVPESWLLPRGTLEAAVALSPHVRQRLLHPEKAGPAVSGSVGDRVGVRDGGMVTGSSVRTGTVVSVNADGSRAVQFGSGDIEWKVPNQWLCPPPTAGSPGARRKAGERVAAPKRPTDSRSPTRFPGSVAAVAGDGSVEVTFDDGDVATLPAAQVSPLAGSVPRRRPSLLAEVQRKASGRRERRQPHRGSLTPQGSAVHPLAPRPSTPRPTRRVDPYMQRARQQTSPRPALPLMERPPSPPAEPGFSAASALAGVLGMPDRRYHRSLTGA